MLSLSPCETHKVKKAWLCPPMSHHPSVEADMSAVTLAQGLDYNKEAEILKYFIGA